MKGVLTQLSKKCQFNPIPSQDTTIRMPKVKNTTIPSIDKYVKQLEPSNT